MHFLVLGVHFLVLQDRISLAQLPIGRSAERVVPSPVPATSERRRPIPECNNKPFVDRAMECALHVPAMPQRSTGQPELWNMAPTFAPHYGIGDLKCRADRFRAGKPVSNVQQRWINQRFDCEESRFWIRQFSRRGEVEGRIFSSEAKDGR